MRKVVDDPRLIYKCCKLYYEENLNQERIADALGVSRVSVSRMLQAGRDAGIVKIEVVSPNHLNYSKLEQELEQMYGLKEAVVVETTPLSTSYGDLTALSAETIHLLETYLHDNDVVGVSMGKTLMNISESTRTSTSNINCLFVPTLGGISSGSRAMKQVHSNQIAASFAQLFGARYEQFFAPAVFADPAVLKGFMKEVAMRRIHQYYKEMNTVIMGIGTPNRTSSTVISAGYITQQQIDEMVDQGMVGDLSLQFFDKNGDTEKFHEFNDRVTGISLKQLQMVENRICVGSGVHKAEAIYGALRGGYINILVTDQNCARELLKKGEGGQ